MFKVNNKDTRRASLRLFCCFFVNFQLISHPFLIFDFCVVEFEKVYICWVASQGVTLNV